MRRLAKHFVRAIINPKDATLYQFAWQHHGNKKPDSLYYLNNEKNTNNLN